MKTRYEKNRRCRRFLIYGCVLFDFDFLDEEFVAGF